MTQRRMLTGDTPADNSPWPLGRFGSSTRRIAEPNRMLRVDCQQHAFTTRSEKPDEIRRDTLQIVRDYLAMGLDPEKTAIFLQTGSAISELTYCSRCASYNVMRNPTLKDEIKVKSGRQLSGTPSTPWDKPQTSWHSVPAVPVGEDQFASS